MKKQFIFLTLTMISLLMNINMAVAHCDTMDGPVVKDAKKAIEQNNVNYVLKWVPADKEKEIQLAFDKMMEVKSLNAEAKEMAEKTFFETLVRVHREGEGVAFTGLQPSGTPVDEKILAADQSIESGNLSSLEKLIPSDRLPELKKRFDKVNSLKNFDVNNVKAGREYIEAYVQFFHYAEGEEQGHSAEHQKHAEH